MNEEIRIVWWNTSISPFREKNRAKGNDKQLARNIVAGFGVAQIEIICLCEVSDADVDFFNDLLKEYGYDYKKSIQYVDGVEFDICAFYRNDILYLADSKDLVSDFHGRALRLALHLNFKVLSDGSTLHLFVTHWPARLNDMTEHDPKRTVLGLSLSQHISARTEGTENKNIIVLGDFNDEPHSCSIAEMLNATRDIEVAKKSTSHLLFYNPFWKYLGEHIQQKIDDESLVNTGTFYFPKGRHNKWYVLDQILISSNFLRGDSWRYLEGSARVLCTPELASALRDPERTFDHLPIASTITKGQ